MCGIVGTINHDLSESDVASLRHRGPDDSGLRHFRIGSHRVSLGHRRLSIVDLSAAGAQPMSTHLGTGCLIFNGEIYNHAELRKLVDGQPFRGHSDTETLLYLLEKNGPDCFGLLNGIFGLAYLNLPARKLYLARDHFGVKPLYWSANSQCLALSSEIRGLSNYISRDVSTEALALLLRHRYVPSPLTLWKDVRKVPPGHFIEVDLGGPELRFRAERFCRRIQVPAPRSDRESVDERYAHVLDRAISRQLMGDVEVGVFLSGGLDSAIASACVRRHLGPGVRAYTVGYEEQDSADEVAVAERIGKSLGLKHRVVRIGEGAFAESFGRVAEIVEEPVAASSMVPLYYLAKLASEDVKVVLSGQGADELLGGYTRYQAARAISLIRRWGAEKPFAFSLKPFLGCQPALRVAAALSRSDAGGCYSGLTELFTCDEIKRLLGTLSVPEADFELPDTRRDFAGVAMALDARTSLPDELLMYTDKVTMHFSLECRVPFLDLELATFVQALPAAARIGLLQRKKLQHSIAKRWLPGVKLPRKKNGFFVPSSSWFGPDSKIRQRLLQTDSAMAGFFDMSEVEKVIRDRDRRAKSDKHLFMLAAIGLWLDRHYRLNPTLVGA